MKSFICLAALLALVATTQAEDGSGKLPTSADCSLDKDHKPLHSATPHVISAYTFKDTAECHLTWQQAGIMQGFPPPPDKLVTVDNLWGYPYNRWMLQNPSKVMRTTSMIFERKPAYLFPRKIDSNLLNKPMIINGRTETMAQFAERSFTDALVILHNGKIVAEWYGDGMTASKPHYAASVTKSVTGLLAELLINQGKLDPNKKVSEYVPELANSPFGPATVRDVLDMKVPVGVGETDSSVADPSGAQLWASIALKTQDSEYDILRQVKADGPKDGSFYYATLTTNVAGWILSRATNKSYEQLAYEELWSKLGIQDDLSIVVDPTGKAGSGYGMVISARDLAKLGQMIANGGKVGGQQVFPAGVIDGLFVHGDRQAWQRGSFKDMTNVEAYRSFWYQPKGSRTIYGAGVYGQMLIINRDHNVVIVKFASMPAQIVKEYSEGWGEALAQLVR